MRTEPGDIIGITELTGKKKEREREYNNLEGNIDNFFKLKEDRFGFRFLPGKI